MNRRLECLYQLLPRDGCGIVDVGTDHAQIPIRLAENGYGGIIIASDIAEGPLQTAQAAATAHRVDDRICFLCCNGLELCPQDAVDTILIAGMGGDTICGILDRAEWLFSRNYRLVLQPMTHADVLRYWLIHNDFTITREAVISDDGHIYQMFCACRGRNGQYSDSEYLTGKRDAEKLGDDPRLLLQWERDRLIKKLEGMKKAGMLNSSAFAFYENIRLELEGILNDADRK